jgi:hypothetical protein
VLGQLPGGALGALGTSDEASALFARAEAHGVTGVLHDAAVAAGAALSPPLAAQLGARQIARELDHAAHLAMLRAVDDALAADGLTAVALKGALFGERFYARPSARATTDIDLLVPEADLERAGRALAAAGYAGEESPSEARFRREHHHLHFAHPHALPLELHFHAYRGFGSVLPSAPLVSRRGEAPLGPWRALGVLAPEDELVYLAVHAAAHRFVRLGWLFDLKLLLSHMSDAAIGEAAERARAWGFRRVVSLAAELLVETLGVDRARVRPLGAVGLVRGTVVRGIVHEPEAAWLRAATRFVYTSSLCDSTPAALRYARVASLGRARRALGLAP